MSDELCRLKDEEEEEEDDDEQNREFKRFAYKACTASFSIPTVRVKALEYS